MTPSWLLPFRSIGNATFFRQDLPAYALFYAPGYLTVVAPENAGAFERNLAAPDSDGGAAITKLRRHAAAAQSAWAEAATRPFAPVCLTLYLSNECNLNCVYCYSEAGTPPAPRLALDDVEAAAQVVAGNCRARRLPFTVVFHGGGEPTLHRRLADEILDLLAQIAAAHDLPLFRYIATNGVLSPAKAAWLAGRFDLVGLSCDGPDAIQSRQRPLRGGASSASTPFVERTAQIVRDAGKPLHVRVTITPQSLHRQTEIAEYVCQQLQPQEIHVEPVYQVGRAEAGDCLTPAQAGGFVAEFLRARAAAGRYGMPWLTSGSRPLEIHGSYCQVFRDVLHLVPGGAATACFNTTSAGQARTQGTLIGEAEGFEDESTGRFTLDQDRIQTLRRALRAEPPQCADCFNRYHCARNCPDHCPLAGTTPAQGFRCLMQKMLMTARLQDMAARLWAGEIAEAGVRGGKVLA